MAADNADLRRNLELLREKYLAKFEPMLDTVDAMLKEAATQEHELRAEIAQLKGQPVPPKPAMLENWVRPLVFEPGGYLMSVDFELRNLKE